mmetsp:Transcript_38591/g.38953  ORF Transcript_38591/g.38953 Transcript_38591/m.38953 type:complete len:89 (+) Transcript_38591:1268-1534(+)
MTEFLLNRIPIPLSLVGHHQAAIIETYDRTDDTSSQDNSSTSSTATISKASSSDVEHPNVAFNKNGMDMLLPLPERKLSLSDTSSVET